MTTPRVQPPTGTASLRPTAAPAPAATDGRSDPLVPAAPLAVQSTPSAPAAPVAAPAQPAAPAAPPLQQQLAAPVITLARADNGDHTVIVRVAPDDLGPVTVHARVSDSGVHIELFAPNDAGRDAIRQVLPDLRRDVNATTANGSVSVSDQNAPSADSSGRERAWSAPRDTVESRPHAQAEETPVPSAGTRPSAIASAHALDIVV